MWPSQRSSLYAHNHPIPYQRHATVHGLKINQPDPSHAKRAIHAGLKEKCNENSNPKYTWCHQKAIFPPLPLKLNLEFIEFIEFAGLVIEEEMPSFEVIVPLRDDAAELFIDSRASARSKTLPLNMAL